MKIAIIDGVNQDIGLKILFPEADYFIFNTEDATANSRNVSYKRYNFTPKTDLSIITDTNYDYIFVVCALYDILPTHYFNQHVKNIFEKVTNIINSNNFKFVALFDNYDFDYDPNNFVHNSKINVFFKRNYNKHKKYNSNVVPFPFIMFGDKSLIEKCDTELVTNDEYFKKKIPRCFFSGCKTSEHFYNYDKDPDVLRDRKYFYDRIKSFLYDPGMLPYGQFINILNSSKFSVDLLGAGDPNKRTFEILLSGSLMISQYNNLLWPFEDDDSFSKETIFKDEHEFVNVINKLQHDNELYFNCLNNQYNIVKKYFNKEWLRTYILRAINT